MALWSTKRRFMYGGGFVVAVTLVFGLIFWSLVYEAPTCSDGIENGSEIGVDCGGSCKNLCSGENLTPVVLWSKIFHVSGDLYTAVAYIQNPNISSKNPKALYEFKIYDTDNKLVITKEGQTNIPKNKKFAVFETGVVVKNSIPKSADFKFTSFSPWEKDTTKEPEVSVKYGTLTSTTTVPRITGTISNLSSSNILELELDVFVLDSKENVVAASRSFVDNLLKNSTQDFVFTWPKPFNLGVESCLNSSDVVIALDRSGSMRSEGGDPPEPFTTVVNTAKDFIKTLTPEDQAGIVSFGTNSTLESSLSEDKQLAETRLDSFFLSTTTLEQTNIAGGLSLSFDELRGANSNPGSKKVIILLTDGIPTEPKKEGVTDNPTLAAHAVARELDSSGVKLYTIGLGKNVSDGFLKSLATEDSYYFFAPTKETLASVYNTIGKSLCPKKPNVITVIYRIP